MHKTRLTVICLLVPEKEDFKVDFSYMGWQPSWSGDLRLKVILRLSHLTDTPYEIWVESTRRFLKKICLNYYAAAQNERHWMKGQMSN